jgi:hypothetical protein
MMLVAAKVLRTGKTIAKSRPTLPNWVKAVIARVQTRSVDMRSPAVQLYVLTLPYYFILPAYHFCGSPSLAEDFDIVKNNIGQVHVL